MRLPIAFTITRHHQGSLKLFDHIIARDPSANPTPITPILESGFESWLATQSDATKSWIAANGFEGKRGTQLSLPGADGSVGTVLIGYADDAKAIWDFAGLPKSLAAGTYALSDDLTDKDDLYEKAALGLYLGGYQFDRYRKDDGKKDKRARIALHDIDAAKRAENIARGIGLARDLINVPANDMGPAELEEAAKALGTEFGAKVSAIVGDELIKQNYPAIHTVGHGSDRAPRLIDLKWGDENAPKITLVGKGVCFDTGAMTLNRQAT